MYESNAPTFNPFAQNVAIVKEYFKRPRMLILGILSVISVCISLLVSFLTTSMVKEVMNAFLAMPGFAEAMGEEALSSMPDTSSSLGSTIGSLIVPVLIAVAYFLIYFKSKNDDPASTPQAGVTILYVLSIIELVIMSIASPVFVICAIIMFIMPAALQEDPTAPAFLGGVFAGLGLFFLILPVFGLISSISKLKYMGSIKNSLTSVNLENKGAKCYGVITLIGAVFGALTVLPFLLVGPLMSSLEQEVPELALLNLGDILGSFTLVIFLTMAVDVAYMAFDAIIALGYKKHIDYYKSSFTQAPPAHLLTIKGIYYIMLDIKQFPV